MDMLCQASPVLQCQLALMVGQHGVGEGGRYGNKHPPHQTTDEVPTLATDQSAD